MKQPRAFHWTKDGAHFWVTNPDWKPSLLGRIKARLHRRRGNTIPEGYKDLGWIEQ